MCATVLLPGQGLHWHQCGAGISTVGGGNTVLSGFCSKREERERQAENGGWAGKPSGMGRGGGWGGMLFLGEPESGICWALMWAHPILETEGGGDCRRPAPGPGFLSYLGAGLGMHHLRGQVSRVTANLSCLLTSCCCLCFHQSSIYHFISLFSFLNSLLAAIFFLVYFPTFSFLLSSFCHFIFYSAFHSLSSFLLFLNKRVINGLLVKRATKDSKSWPKTESAGEWLHLLRQCKLTPQPGVGVVTKTSCPGLWF